MASRCRLCGRDVLGGGVAFRAGGRVLFVVCPEHAPVVEAGLDVAARAIGAGAHEFLRQKMPRVTQLWTVFTEVVRQRQALRGPPS